MADGACTNTELLLFDLVDTLSGVGVANRNFLKRTWSEKDNSTDEDTTDNEDHGLWIKRLKQAEKVIDRAKQLVERRNEHIRLLALSSILQQQMAEILRLGTSKLAALSEFASHLNDDTTDDGQSEPSTPSPTHERRHEELAGSSVAAPRRSRRIQEQQNLQKKQRIQSRRTELNSLKHHSSRKP